MSNAELPRTVEPIRLAEQNVRLEGVIPLAGLPRFRESVSQIPDAAGCQVSLVFSRDSERRLLVQGSVKTEDVLVQCQRCMTDMVVQLASDFTLGLVSGDDQARQLPTELEPFIMDGFSADLWTLAEDELLLVLPSFPLHERDECPATGTLEAFEPDTVVEEAPAERENPFEVLKNLKTTKH